MVLQVVEPRGTLNIGQRFGIRHVLPLEHRTAADRPLELADKLLQVMLNDALQVR